MFTLSKEVRLGSQLQKYRGIKHFSHNPRKYSNGIEVAPIVLMALFVYESPMEALPAMMEFGELNYV